MVKIITDTTSCLPTSFAKKHSIPVIPQIINFGNQSYIEGVNLENAHFLLKLKTATELPKTAAPSPDFFIQEFARLLPLGEPILCIHPSADVSGTVRSALTAAAEFPGAPIHVLDSRLIAGPLASMVMLAVEWAEQGIDVETIKARLQEMTPRCRIYFLVATLEYLARGGRIGGAQALLGGLLQIKPLLTFENGKVDQFERERTMKQALRRLKELVTSQVRPGSVAGREQPYLSVMHGGVPEQAQKLAEELEQELALPDVPIYDMPPAIVTHAGPGILAVGFFVENKGIAPTSA